MFEVGEVAIVIEGVQISQRNFLPKGTEVTIVGPRQPVILRETLTPDGYGYRVTWPGMKFTGPAGFGYLIAERLLKKRPGQDKEQTLPWSECIWKPKHVHV
jgi:hypothetical protein